MGTPEATDVAAQRLAAQQVASSSCDSAVDVVRWMGAMQAQDPLAARWAVGLRMRRPSSDADIARAVGDGALVRIHAMRGTWQLVAPEDVRWLVALVGPRVLASASRRHAELGLDARAIDASTAALARATRTGAHLTRSELAEVIEAAGVSAAGQRLAHLLGAAELRGVLCGGPSRGKQPTWCSLDERAPVTGAARMDRAQAAAELARRYAQSRSPATADDFTWWSGLPAAEARAAFDAATRATPVRTARTKRATNARSAPRAHLLPPFDEMLIGYRVRDALLDPRHAAAVNAGGGMLGGLIVLDARAVGTWRRTVVERSRRVDVELSPFARLARRDREAVVLAAQRYAAFLGLDLDVR